MKDITLSEFLSIIHNGDIDKIEKIEKKYHINIYSETGLWYGDKITIENNYNIPVMSDEEIEKENYKYDVFERYNFLSNNPSKKTNEERCLLLDVIVNNNWSNEYFELYPSKYGL